MSATPSHINTLVTPPRPQQYSATDAIQNGRATIRPVGNTRAEFESLSPPPPSLYQHPKLSKPKTTTKSGQAGGTVNQEHEHAQAEETKLRTKGTGFENVATSSTLTADDDPILTPQEAAWYLRISASLLRHARTGKIKAFHVGKLWRFRKSWLDEYAQSSVSFFRHPCRE